MESKILGLPGASPTAQANEGSGGAGKHTPGRYIFTHFTTHDGRPIETVDDVAATLAASARYSDRAELWGVSLDDADETGASTVICYTGNGPNAHNNARLFAATPQVLNCLGALVECLEVNDLASARHLLPECRAAISTATGGE